MKTTSTRAKVPTKVGTAFAGGFYAGRILIDSIAYALVVSPKAGEHEPIAWHSNEKMVKGATSYADGLANTAAMAKSGSPLAKWAKALEIGGHKDWYLPSRLESLVLFGELRDLPAFKPDAENGIPTEWHWTSTQYASNPSYAWSQSFLNGGQGGYRKGLHGRARVVRRIVIK